MHIFEQSKYHIILGSGSPRRKELLAQLGFKFEVKVREVLENFPSELAPAEVPLFLAEKKASVFNDLGDNDLLITADTVVICEKEVLGKPESSDHAIQMLLKLAGKTHQVVTGVHFRCSDQHCSFSETTYVEFSSLTLYEITWYINNFQPLDKAGAYGIQDWVGTRAIRKIDGSYTNVVGLPTERLYSELTRFMEN